MVASWAPTVSTIKLERVRSVFTSVQYTGDTAKGGAACIATRSMHAEMLLIKHTNEVVDKSSVHPVPYNGFRKYGDRPQHTLGCAKHVLLGASHNSPWDIPVHPGTAVHPNTLLMLRARTSGHMLSFIITLVYLFVAYTLLPSKRVIFKALNEAPRMFAGATSGRFVAGGDCMVSADALTSIVDATFGRRTACKNESASAFPSTRARFTTFSALLF